MKTPESLETLADYGIIQEVVRPLMSGKEAQIYVVVAEGEFCVAKVYKEATQRTFKHRVEYTEGRRTRNSRDQRAISKRTRHGKKRDEAAWRSAEVDMIFRLRDAGVRVPEPINFVDGVLVMELVKDAHGDPAPRLGDLSFGPAKALEIFQHLIREVVRMLCAGVIHGDLSDFNVLMGADGPVLIDFPQSVDAAHNQSARRLLLRDVENLHRFLERCAPEQVRQPYAEEMWSLYEANRLEPDTLLRGNYRAPQGKANTAEVLALIEDADREEQARRDARGEEAPLKATAVVTPIEPTAPVAPRPLRTVVDFTKEASSRPRARGRTGDGRAAGPKRRRGRTTQEGVAAKAAAVDGAAPPKRKRPRRRMKRSTDAVAKTGASAPRGEKKASAEKKVGSDAADGARPRRRRARSGSRTKSGEAATNTQSGAKPASTTAAGARGGRKLAAPKAGADRPTRPSRRRRRRSSGSGSRETT